MKYSPDQIEERLRLAGEDFAEKNAAAELLEETKKVVFSKLCSNSTEKTQGAKETSAYCQPEYEEHIISMVEARKVANKARVKYESGRIWVDLLRSKEATERHAYKG